MIETENLEPVLVESIQRYERILEFLQKMDTEIGTASPSMVLELSESLALLQGQATQTDQVLLTLLRSRSALSKELQTLLDTRASFVNRILALNEHIKTKAIGIKSLLGHEMEKLRKGMSALGGYQHRPNSQGRIINSTS